MFFIKKNNGLKIEKNERFLFNLSIKFSILNNRKFVKK